MGDHSGFKKYKRMLPAQEDAETRVKHFRAFDKEPSAQLVHQQSARCMDCGVPFCHAGCPLGNVIPDFNEAVYKEDWRLAYDILSATNNFPEFTGRICPAPCEASCVLNINSDPVTIEYIEKSIIERAFEEGWVIPDQHINKNGSKVAVIGSGPAGMACAEQLNRAGYAVDLYERNEKIGGLLRYGIPDFKLEKEVIDRRVHIMETSGINMLTSVNVGYDIRGESLLSQYDAVALTGGSTIPRDLPINGRGLKGVHFAMDYLEQVNRAVDRGNGEILTDLTIDVKGKNVVVIGGGDTGADCLGTSHRLGARSVTQLELLTKPSVRRDAEDLWPNWPMVLRSSTSHAEGGHREWSVQTKRFLSEDGIHLSGIELIQVEWSQGKDGKYSMHEKVGSEKIIACTVVLLAIGFGHPQKVGLLDQLNIDLDTRGNVKTKNYRTSVDRVYAAGDMRRGQSLVVWAIAEGREAAAAIHKDLSGDGAFERRPVLSVEG